MPLRLSTGLRNVLNNGKVSQRVAINGADTIAFTAPNEIADSGNNFLIGGLKAGDKIMLKGAGEGANNGLYTVNTIAQGLITTVESSIATEAAGAELIISALISASWRDVFRDGVLRIFSGSQPTTADDAETGVHLLTITRNSLTFVAGQPANGINFGASAGGILAKAMDEIWSGVGLINGTAGWFRYYTNALHVGSHVDHIRFDGACGSSGAQLNMSSLSIVSGATTTIDSFNVTLPATIA